MTERVDFVLERDALGNLEAPPTGLDYARVGDLVEVEDETGRRVVSEVIAAWTRPEGDAA